MGGVSSVPQLIGGLATRLLYYLIGANYKTPSLAQNKDSILEVWRGRDYHVYDRFGSQYFDKDGDRAHEFYEEQILEDNRAVMIKQERSSLKHEGRIRYKVPRLHHDFPAVIMSQ